MPPRSVHRPWRTSTRAAVLSLLTSLSAFQCLSAQEWTPVEWNGERAWKSDSGDWSAVVSEKRARLVSIGPRATSINLLWSPPEFSVLALGAHRFWLGPQTEWTSFWPPPTDWEGAAASGVSTKDGVLRARLPRTDHGFPRITRTYAWDGDRLKCGAEWDRGERSHQGIHILQFPADGTTVRAVPKATDEVPRGFILLPLGVRPSIQMEFPALPESLVRAGDDGRLVIRHGGIEEKIGLPPQTLLLSRGDYELAMSRGAMRGKVVDVPDAGMLSQVYLGDARNPIIELEQLSPRLAPEGGEPAFFEIEIAVRKIPPAKQE